MARSRGFALVLVVTSLVLMTILAVSFLVGTSTELASARLYKLSLDKTRFSSTAVNLAISQINAATMESSGNDVRAWTSQPGMLRTFDQQGRARNIYRIYSHPNPVVDSSQLDINAENAQTANWKSGVNDKEYNAQWCDLNSPITLRSGSRIYPVMAPTAQLDSSAGVQTDNPNTTTQEGVQGFEVSSPPGFSTGGGISAANNPAPMPVRWLYVLQDGSMVAPGSGSSGARAVLAGSTNTNPPVARVAYWADDETTKVNINTASEGVFWDVPYGMNNQERGNNSGTLGFATSVPVSDEYQRLAGHPAFTSLSAVLGLWLPRPAVPELVQFSEAAHDAGFAPYYRMAPRIENGGSKGGSRTGIGAPITLDADRLYASAQEFYFRAPAAGASLPYERERNHFPSSLVPTEIQRLGFFISHASNAPEINLFGEPRIAIWPLQAAGGPRNAKDRLMAFASTINNASYFIQRAAVYTNDSNPGSSQSPLRDFDPSDPTGAGSRNRVLANYLASRAALPVPGYSLNNSATLRQKYPTQYPQIIGSMIDSVRSLLNTSSRTLQPSYSYAPLGPAGSPNNPVGVQGVVPLRMTIDGSEVKGLGRYPTVREVLIIFYASGWKDETRLNATAPHTPSAGADGLPDDEPNSGGAFNGVGDPRTNQMRAVVMVMPHLVSPGNPLTAPAVRYQIDGLENLSVTYAGNTQSLGFPSAPNAVLLTRSNATFSHDAEMGYYHHFAHPWTGSGPGAVFENNFVARRFGISNGITSSTAKLVPQQEVFPWFSHPVAINPPAQPHSHGLTTTGTYNLMRSGVTASTFNFSGGRLRIRIFPGSSNNFDQSADLVQELEVEFPPATLPVPYIIRPKFLANDNDTRDFSNTYAVNDPNDWRFYCGLNITGGADGRDFESRLNSQFSPSDGFGHTRRNSVIRRGDVIRSVQVNPAGPSKGDMRTVASLRFVSRDHFAPTPGYADSNVLQANGTPFRTIGNINQSFRIGYGYADGGPPRQVRVSDNPDLVKRDMDRRVARGTLDGTLTFSQHNMPIMSAGAADATMDVVGGGSIAGDWSTGVANTYDGGHINKGDEGFAQTGQFQNVYYIANLSNMTSDNYAVSYSPTRQVSSPVFFGSLPSGVTPQNSLVGTVAQQPWRTLLFCPNPAGGNNHPGFGVGSGGPGQGPANRAPYSILPDHLLLDYFWMPAIEPYAISQTASTAGKINLNQQIMPFGHIRRHTGLYSLLKSLKIAAIPNNQAGVYKHEFNAADAVGNPVYRRDVDIEATLVGFTNRWDGGNHVFRSASEITQIYLVPQPGPGGNPPAPTGSPADRYNSTPAWWSGYRLTGDNLRENPYDKLYSRITTQSNTYRVHWRIQVLAKSAGTAAGEWVENSDQITGEYRGSTLIERFIDPRDTSIADYAPTTSLTQLPRLYDFYRWRVVSNQQFNP